MKNVFESFKEKEVKNIWAITGGAGDQTDGEDARNDNRGDAEE